MKTIKVGVVGCGNAALLIDLNEKKSKVNLVSHLSILKKNKNFKLIACCDVDLSKFKKLKKIFKDINVYNSFQKMINLEKDIDLLIISTPTSYHYSQCKIALKHKNLKMVVCEKPFGFNYHNALEIVKEFKKTKKYLLISYQRRFDPFFIKIKRLIKNKILGRLVSITAQVDKAFFQNSSHMIDLIMWTLNKKPLYVTSYSNSIVTKKTNFRKQSFIVYMFEFSKNIIVKITANAAGIYKHFHEVKIFEKKKTLVNSYLGSYMFKKKGTQTQFKKLNYEYPDKKNRKKLIQNFIDILIDKRSNSIISFKDQYNLMKVCFAADRSITLKKKIKIRY